MIRLNLVALHIFFFLSTIFFFEKVDHTNLALSLLISFLILNEYFNDKFYFLTANKIFLIGGYYYLVIFPVFYSIGFIKAETFVSSDLTLACVVSLFSVTGYIIVEIFIFFIHQSLIITLGITFMISKVLEKERLIVSY